MHTLTLLVKGNRFEAAKAASDRGIPFVFKEEFSSGHEDIKNTRGVTSEEHRLPVMNWFGENPDKIEGYGFPDGTLLLFTHPEPAVLPLIKEEG